MARRHRRTIIDLGTGDGRAVLAAAAADSSTLAVGIDADARAMAEASRRAARKPNKGGLSNAVFVAAGVETLPDELAGLADLVTVRFPWGSMLRGALGLDDRAAIAIARLVAPAGALEMTVSITERDAVGDGRPTGPFGEPDVERIRKTYADLGFRLCDVRSLNRADLRAIDSSWARRLRVDRDRVAWVLRLELPGRRLVSADPAQIVQTTTSQA